METSSDINIFDLDYSSFEEYVNVQIKKRDQKNKKIMEVMGIREKFDELLSYTRGAVEWCLHWRNMYFWEHQMVLELTRENRWLCQNIKN